MTLSALFVAAITILGGWALFFTGRMLNLRQTQPSVLLLIRILFVLLAVLLLLTQFGAIKNSVS